MLVYNTQESERIEAFVQQPISQDIREFLPGYHEVNTALYPRHDFEIMVRNTMEMSFSK